MSFHVSLEVLSESLRQIIIIHWRTLISVLIFVIIMVRTFQEFFCSKLVAGTNKKIMCAVVKTPVFFNQYSISVWDLQGECDQKLLYLVLLFQAVAMSVLLHGENLQKSSWKKIYKTVAVWPCSSYLTNHWSITYNALCPWCNSYCCRKWTPWHGFKSWTRLIAFHIALIP